MDKASAKTTYQIKTLVEIQQGLNEFHLYCRVGLFVLLLEQYTFIITKIIQYVYK